MINPATIHLQNPHQSIVENSQLSLFPPNNPFESFWMAGFECTDQINAFGNRVDFLEVTGHLTMLEDDYKNLSILAMKTVREGIRWSVVEKSPYVYDFSTVGEMIRIAQNNDIQQVWDICHFGFPDDLTPLHPMFARRFASLCRAFVKFYRTLVPNGELIVTPINEVSFLSWLGGDVRGTSPFCVGQGWEVKYRLMKAYIEGIEAMKEADETIRIMTTEPLANIIPHENAGQEEIDLAERIHENQFQVLDILCGKMCPELRGKPEYLDILGYNYYYNNQWIISTHQFLDWQRDTDDSRYIPLHQLLKTAYQRYQRPFVLTETSHPREDRPQWIKMIAEECALLLTAGLPFWGICWYPILNRPDWDDLTHWHYSGVWEDVYHSFEKRPRELHLPTVQAIFESQDLLKKCLESPQKV